MGTNGDTIVEKIEGRERNCSVRIAIIGSPNVGKSVLYNILTGGKASIANWPGSTVEYHVGRLRIGGKENNICLIDLPGTYSLLPTSPEEEVTRDYLLYRRPDYVMVLMDGLAPEKSLAVVVQALEAFPGKTFIVLTKQQLAHARGIHIDINGLSRILGVPLIPVSVLENIGVAELASFIESISLEKRVFAPKARIDYGVLEPYINRMCDNRSIKELSERTGAAPRWMIANIIAGDKHLLVDASILIGKEKAEDIKTIVEAYVQEFRRAYGKEPAEIVVESRFALVRELSEKTIVRYQKELEEGLLDRVFRHPYTGPIATVLILLATFFIAFSINTGFPLNMILDKVGFHGAAEALESYSISGILSYAFALLGEMVKNTIGGMAGSLLGDGVINGVGFLLSFLPLIMIVFLVLGILEDTGLVARMSYSFHHILEPFGLSGKSLFPLIMGIGCNVPAVVATRALSETEKKRALFAVPFIPCQARLAVILAFTAAFIKGPLLQSFTVLSIYLVSLGVALLTSLITALFYSKQRGEPRRIELLLEVPPLHRPSWRVVWWYLKENTIHFLEKAGSIIFIMSIVSWALTMYGPQGFTLDASTSFAALIGRKMSFILGPLGLGKDVSWKLTFALIEGLVAKEVVLGSLAVIEGLPESAGTSILSHYGLTGAQVFSYLLIVSLYMPCIATLAAMIGELRDIKKPLLYLIYTVAMAFLVGYLSYFILTLH